MPGVNPPNNERLLALIGGFDSRLRALESQQQRAITNAQGQPIVNIGLVPGSDPARYGIQFVDPNTGSELAFLGESAGATTLALLLETGGSIEIDNGGSLTLKSSSGTTVFYAGTENIPDGSGRTQQVLNLTRDDGTNALLLADLGTTPGHTHQQALQWFDRNNNVVLADDTDSGIGLARPHLTLGQLANTDTSTWPGTSATTWTDIANGYFERQNPQFTWTFELYAPAGVTGQFRMVFGGVQVGATQTVTGGTSGTYSFWSDTQPVPAATGWGSIALLQLEAQVTVGTGKILASQLYLQGIQS